MDANIQELECLLFSDLRKDSEVDKESFMLCLEEIYKELSESSSKGVNLTRFSDFLMNCPMFVAEKFFLSLLDKSKKEKDRNLTFDEFSLPMITFKFGSYEEVLNVIFKIFDFDSDGIDYQYF